MAKNFADLYNTPNDSSGLEQRVFLKKETTRGTPVIPAGTDYWLQNAGGSANLNIPFNPSSVRSGRQNVTGIREKQTTEWSYPAYFHVDTTLGSASDSEIDQAVKTLWENLLGKENNIAGGAANLQYNTSKFPDTSYTVLENGDVFAKQYSLGFAQSGTFEFPGDGVASYNLSGRGRNLKYIGIAKSTVSNDGGNTVTVESGDEKKLQVGGLVMIIEADGTTRSADTPDGDARTIQSIVGQIVTLDGAVLADADGSGVDAPIYLCFYEPETPTAINDPQTGLVGSITVGSYTIGCVASASVSVENNHYTYDGCFGEKGMSDKGYASTSRVQVTLNVELMMSANVLKLLIDSINDLDDGNPTGVAVELILGDSTGRHFRFYFPKWIPTIPPVEIPEEGVIPVPFTGTCYSSSESAADCILIEAK